MTTRIGRGLVIVLAAIGAAAVAGGWALLRGGISARTEPGAFEAAAAARLRSLAIPASAKHRQNPVSQTPEVLDEGMAHWADHCATCHGNDGSGDTAIGRALYPRAPDMRLPATQDLTDGTLFYIIEQGVKLTGMPGWGDGTPDGEISSWQLVHFIRRLPGLTAEDLARMSDLNPKTPAQWREEEEIRKFLEGEGGDAPKPAAAPHKHGGRE